MRQFVALAVIVALTVGLAAAQDVVKGEWKQSYKDEDVQLKPPADDAVVVKAEPKSFAQGECDATLAKGGPAGAFLWAHLHGRHNDRLSKTKYKGVILIKDKGGFYYGVTPVIEMEVEGVPDKPARDKHAYGQFVPEGDTAKFLKQAIENKTEIIIEIAMSRERKDGDFVADILKGPFKDAVLAYFGVPNADAAKGAAELLKKLNEGKKPGGK